MARTTYDRTLFTTGHMLDEAVNSTYLKKLISTPGFEGQFWYRLDGWFDLLAEDATAAVSKGWVKAYNRSLKFEGKILRYWKLT